MTQVINHPEDDHDPLISHSNHRKAKSRSTKKLVEETIKNHPDALDHIKPDALFWWKRGERLVRLDKTVPSSYHYRYIQMKVVDTYNPFDPPDPLIQEVPTRTIETKVLYATFIDTLDGTRHRFPASEAVFVPAVEGDLPSVQST